MVVGPVGFREQVQDAFEVLNFVVHFQVLQRPLLLRLIQEDLLRVVVPKVGHDGPHEGGAKYEVDDNGANDEGHGDTQYGLELRPGHAVLLDVQVLPEQLPLEAVEGAHNGAGDEADRLAATPNLACQEE